MTSQPSSAAGTRYRALRALHDARRVPRRSVLLSFTTAVGLLGAGALAACGSATTAPAAATVAPAPSAVAAATSTTAAPASTSALSSGTSSAASASSAAPAASATSARAAAEPVQVLDAWGNGPWVDTLYTGWAQGLQQALPNVKVEFIMTGDFKGGSTAKTAAMIAAGTPPDLTLGSDVSFALKDAIVDLKGYFDRDKDITTWKFYPPCWQYVNIVLDNGHPMLWAFPGNPDARVIYANLDLLQKAGVAYDPAQHWDWSTFEDHAKALTKRAADGTIEQLGFSGLWNFGDPYVLAQYAGGGYFERDATTGWVNKATFSAAGTQRGLSFFRTLMVEDKVGLQPDEKLAGGFAGGKIAMAPSWSSQLSSLRQTTNPNMAHFQWDVMGFPVEHAGDAWPHQFANGSQMGSLVQGAKHLDAAFTVGKYFVGDGHVIRMQAMGGPPQVINHDGQQAQWKKQAPGTHYSQLFDQVMATGDLGAWSKIKLHGTEIMDAYNKNVVQLLQAKLGVSDFATAMDSAANALLQQP